MSADLDWTRPAPKVGMAAAADPDALRDEATYEHMKPALRLATMFLVHPAVAQFWVTAVVAVPVTDPTTGRSHFKPDVPVTDANLGTVQEGLSYLSEDLAFEFKTMVLTASGVTATWHHSIGCIRGVHKKDENRPWKFQMCHHIMLHEHFSEYLTHSQDPESRHYHKTNPNLYLRTMWQIATVLAHEVGHAMYNCRSGIPFEHKTYHSLLDPMVEEGFAWEDAVFGTINSSSQINLPETHSSPVPFFGLWALDWQYIAKGADPELWDDPMLAYAVSMDWVAQQFDDDFWRQEFGVLQKKLRTQKTSVGVWKQSKTEPWARLQAYRPRRISDEE